VYPPGQVQTNPFPLFMQVPPFRQGELPQPFAAATIRRHAIHDIIITFSLLLSHDQSLRITGLVYTSYCLYININYEC